VVKLADQALANDELLRAEGPACTPMYRAMVALIVCDELARAAEKLTLALAEARRLGSPTAFVWASAWRSVANNRLGRLLDAEADARAAAECDYELYRRLDRPTAGLVDWRRPATGIINYRVHGARALIGLGHLNGAPALVEEELPLARALGTHRETGITLHVAGLLEQGEIRIVTLKHAVEELAQSQSRLEYARALYDYGAALRRANRRSEARPPLQAALTIAREARAAPLRDSAAQELKATGARVSRPAHTGVDALTASEHRIASMAAGGMSNRDIAQALFVTIKTVETHIGHIYQKLNLTRRMQLAEALGQGGTGVTSVLDARLANGPRAHA
jgi:DNA-binding CsgD family transcriptional regulator